MGGRERLGGVGIGGKEAAVQVTMAEGGTEPAAVNHLTFSD